jgi:hypothetical protein
MGAVGYAGLGAFPPVPPPGTSPDSAPGFNHITVPALRAWYRRCCGLVDCHEEGLWAGLHVRGQPGPGRINNFVVSRHSLGSANEGAVSRTLNATMQHSFAFFNAHSPTGGAYVCLLRLPAPAATACGCA